MKSIDIKINNAKRRAEAERQQSTPKPTPTMGLTIPRSTPENGAPMKKRIQDLPRATELAPGHCVVISTPTGHDGLYPQWALARNTELTGTCSISPEGGITYVTGGVDMDLTTPETVRSIIAEQAGECGVMRVKMPDFDLAEGDSFDLFTHFGAARDISVYIKFDNAGQAFVEMAYVKA